MKYYDEDRMREIRVEFEKRLSRLPDVEFKKMFGCPCYKHNGKLFAFLVTDGVVVLHLSEKDREKLASEFPVKGFSTGKRIMGRWPQVLVKNKSGLKPILAYVRKSYAATAQPG